MAIPVRSISFPFAGDTWAAPGAQTAPPVDVPRLVVTSSPVVWRIVPVDGSGVPVDDAVTTLDACLVVLGEDDNGSTTVARTSLLSACAGEAQLTGWLLVDELAVGSTFVPGVPTVSIGMGSASGLRVFVDAGAGLLP